MMDPKERFTGSRPGSISMIWRYLVDAGVQHLFDIRHACLRFDGPDGANALVLVNRETEERVLARTGRIVITTVRKAKKLHKEKRT